VPNLSASREVRLDLSNLPEEPESSSKSTPGSPSSPSEKANPEPTKTPGPKLEIPTPAHVEKKVPPRFIDPAVDIPKVTVLDPPSNKQPDNSPSSQPESPSPSPSPSKPDSGKPPLHDASKTNSPVDSNQNTPTPKRIASIKPRTLDLSNLDRRPSDSPPSPWKTASTPKLTDERRAIPVLSGPGVPTLSLLAPTERESRKDDQDREDTQVDEKLGLRPPVVPKNWRTRSGSVALNPQDYCNFPVPRDDDDIFDPSTNTLLTSNQIGRFTNKMRKVMDGVVHVIDEFDRPIGPALKAANNEYITYTLKDKKVVKEWQELFPDGQYALNIKNDFLNDKVIDVSMPQDDRERIVSFLDPFDFGWVTPIGYMRFLKGFGPSVNKMPKKVHDLSKQNWFLGYWDEVCARKLISGCPNDTFFVHMLPQRPDRVLLLNKIPEGIVVRSVFHVGTTDAVKCGEPFFCPALLDTQRSPKSKRGRNSGTNPDNSNIKDKQRYPRRSLTSAPPGGEVKSKNEGKSPRVHKGSRVSLEHPLEPPPMATPRQPSPEKHTMRNSTELRAALGNLFLPDEEFPSLIDLVRLHIEKLNWVPFDNNITKSAYFQPCLAPIDARQKLEDAPVGTGLVCISDNQASSFLDVIYRDLEKVEVIPLIRVMNGLKQLNLSTGDITIYSSIGEFIDSHPQITTNWHSSGCPTIPLVPFVEPFEPWDEVVPAQDIWGPEQLDEGCHITRPEIGISVGTRATYPRGTQAYNCLCDAFRIRRLGNRLIAVLCDGCALGRPAREAAQTAARAFCDYLSNKHLQENFLSATFLFKQLDNILRQCHREISRGKKAVFDAGTTTLCGGIVCRVDNKSNDYAFMCISVGDCKALHYSQSSQRLSDITYGSRANSKDAKDCGGRLGPYIGKKGDPDLRNKAFYYTAVKPGDFIIIVSDGVYDNFDPEHLGVEPDLLPSYSKFFPGEDDKKKWLDIPLDIEHKLKQEFLVEALNTHISHLPSKTPANVVSSLIDYAYRTTKPSRQLLEENPASHEPNDYKLYPGKMDHTTCVCIEITDLDPQNQLTKQGLDFSQKNLYKVAKKHTQQDPEPGEMTNQKKRKSLALLDRGKIDSFFEAARDSDSDSHKHEKDKPDKDKDTKDKEKGESKGGGLHDSSVGIGRDSESAKREKSDRDALKKSKKNGKRGLFK